jgi:hypothetical protein
MNSVLQKRGKRSTIDNEITLASQTADGKFRRANGEWPAGNKGLPKGVRTQPASSGGERANSDADSSLGKDFQSRAKIAAIFRPNKTSGHPPMNVDRNADQRSASFWLRFKYTDLPDFCLPGKCFFGIS